MVTEKLNEYIISKGISMYAFENSLGASRGSISKAIKENKSIGSQVIENILIAYPDINPDWLLTGRGSMLRGDQAQPLPQPVAQSVSPVNEPFIYKLYKEKEAENKALTAKMLQMAEEIGKLKAQVGIPYKEPEHPSLIEKETEAFTSDSLGVYGKDSVHMRKPTSSKRSSGSKTQ